NLRSVVIAALFGAPLPLCSCGVLPAAAGLRRQGASRSATVSFLISTPETGVDSIALTYGLLGPVMAIVRPVVAVITAIVAGVVSIGIRDDQHEDRALENELARMDDHCHEGKTCESEKPLVPALQPGGPGRVRRVLRYAFVTLLDDIAFWMVIGIVLSGVLSAALPDDFFTRVIGWDSGLLPMLAMAVVGVPLYLCASASTPVAAALLAKGLSPGAALVFLLTGPASSAASIAVVGKMLGPRRLKAYLGSIAGVSIAAGLLLDLYGADAVRRTMLAASEATDSPSFAAVKTASAALFVLALGASMVRTRFHDGLRDLRVHVRGLADGASTLTWRDLFTGPSLALMLALIVGVVGPRMMLVVEPGQLGIVRQLGRVIAADLEPGVHFHLPPPFGRGDAVDVDLVRDVPVGFRGLVTGRRAGNEDASFYLTADENILDVRSVLQYRVSDPVAYALGAGQVDDTLRGATRAVLVDLIAGRPIDALYTTERHRIEQAAGAAVRREAEALGLGVTIVGVRLLDVHAPGDVHDAFRDVASALEDRQREISDADGYAAEQAATAGGQSAELREQAAAAAATAVGSAHGQAARFAGIAAGHAAAPRLTQLRLYLETVERALAKATKYINGSRATTGDIDLWIGSTGSKELPPPPVAGATERP
ncbi:MAG TPA: SO_0444 family Cu/Zn efflux transporter, partial [Candidatus Binatia bacterium]|nr:SO_0444 family Cu/Zn efflux transporter [Candidatus Binatia bacterium]